MKMYMVEFVSRMCDYAAERNHAADVLRYYHMAEGAMRCYDAMFFEQNGCIDSDCHDWWYDDMEPKFNKLISWCDD